MKTPRHSCRKQSESGIALLIAIFALMLISAVAISLIVASGTESSLAGNYRSSTSAYYAGFAGLEEARGRVVPSNPNYFDPAAGAPFLPVGTLRYIVNPAPGEIGGATMLVAYPDTEYDKEYPGMAAYAAAIKTTTNSVSTVAGIQGPLYKWVRINAATERSLNIDVNGGGLDNVTPLFYDAGLNPPSLIVPPSVAGVPNSPPTARQALEVTALAVLPNGSQKTVQYVVAPVSFGLNFPSALTLAGNIGTFNGANSNQYFMNGNDGSGNPPAIPGCVPNGPRKYAIGVSPGADPNHSPQTNEQYVENLLPRPDHYVGQGGTGAATVNWVLLTGNLQSPDTLAQLLQTLQQNADAVVQPNPPGATYDFGGPGWPSGMSATNPKVVYVDGDFNLGPNTGYGILVVTGNFRYDGNSGWKGIILVIGDGTTTFDGNGGGNGEFDGAIYVATIHDANGNLLPSLGTVNFDIAGGGGNGIYYNSCWINKVQQPPSYLVLSFREIAQ